MKSADGAWQTALLGGADSADVMELGGRNRRSADWPGSDGHKAQPCQGEVASSNPVFRSKKRQPGEREAGPPSGTKPPRSPRPTGADRPEGTPARWNGARSIRTPGLVSLVSMVVSTAPPPRLETQQRVWAITPRR